MFLLVRLCSPHNAINTIENLTNAIHLSMQEVHINDNMLDVRSCHVINQLRESLKKSGGLFEADQQAYGLTLCGLRAIRL